MAIERARASGIADVEFEPVIVVGDTPFDVACALAAGAVPIGVATGGFTVDRLRDSGAGIVFKDLRDTQAFLG